MHRWLALQVPADKPDQLTELDRLLTGPRTIHGVSAAVDPEAGVRPPAWWDGDDDATASSFAAAAQR
jgi:hypothetical protein